MSKRKPLNASVLRSVGGVLGELVEVEPLAATAPEEKPSETPAAQAEPPAPRAPRAPKPKKPADATGMSPEEERTTRQPTTHSVQLYRYQRQALEDAARERKRRKGWGREDASAVLRELVDRWIEEGGE